MNILTDTSLRKADTYSRKEQHQDKKVCLRHINIIQGALTSRSRTLRINHPLLMIDDRKILKSNMKKTL